MLTHPYNDTVAAVAAVAAVVVVAAVAGCLHSIVIASNVLLSPAILYNLRHFLVMFDNLMNL